MSNPKFRVSQRCEDCGGQGWYPWQHSPDDPEPDQVQCVGCNGFGYIDLPDDEITPAKLEAEGWQIDALDFAELVIDLSNGVKITHWPDGDVWVHGGRQCVCLPGVRTLPQLRALVSMLSGGGE